MVWWPSGEALVLKTENHGFNPHPCLLNLFPKEVSCIVSVGFNVEIWLVVLMYPIQPNPTFFSSWVGFSGMGKIKVFGLFFVFDIWFSKVIATKVCRGPSLNGKQIKARTRWASAAEEPEVPPLRQNGRILKIMERTVISKERNVCMCLLF